MYTKTSSNRWLRKAQVRARYGGVSNKSIERHVAAKRLPPPEYPLSNRIPFWDEGRLDENDRQAALARRAPAASGRPYQKAAVAEEETAA
jgi:hypothetical protein